MRLFLIFWVPGVVFFWLITSFIVWNLNPSDWKVGDRGFLALLVVLWTLMIFLGLARPAKTPSNGQ